MKYILVFGAGKPATSLIDYLTKEAAANNWIITIADAIPVSLPTTATSTDRIQTVVFSPHNDTQRRQLIAAADLVISLLPPALHVIIASECLQYKKHLLSPAAVDESMLALQHSIKQQGLLFLCEMGLNSGIDHMSAMHHIHRIKANGGTITSFRSHCGSLIAPESDDNPWHYKITGAPNIVLAGKEGAVFKENGAICQLPYEQLFDPNRVIDIPDLGYLAWYPNHDSLHYMPLYGLPDASTFIRTTLRYPSFVLAGKM